MAYFSLYGYLTYGYNLIRLQFECICICSQVHVGDIPSTTSHRVHGPLCICSLQKLIFFAPLGSDERKTSRHSYKSKAKMS